MEKTSEEDYYEKEVVLKFSGKNRCVGPLKDSHEMGSLRQHNRNKQRGIQQLYSKTVNKNIFLFVDQLLRLRFVVSASTFTKDVKDKKDM